MRTPVDYAVATVNQSFLVVTHECVENRRRAVFVHCKGFFRPVAGSAETFELFDYSSAVLFFPRPCAFEEPVSAYVGFGESFFLLHLLDDFDLGRNGRVVGAGKPKRFITRHSFETDNNILNGLVERVSHMKLSRDVGRRHHNGERFFFVVGVSLEELTLLPEVVNPLFELGIVSFVHLFHNLVSIFLFRLNYY